jgi:hypothetical protein
MAVFWSTYFNTNIDFYYVCYYDCVEFIECLMEEIRSEQNDDVMNSGLYGACARGCVSIVSKLVDGGASDLNGGLQRASICGNLSVVKFLVNSGANNLNCALREACLFGYDDIVVYLLEKGANHVCSALQCACYNGDVNIVRILLDHGVVNWEDGFFEACLQSNNRDVVNLFLDRHANAHKYLCLFESACCNGWVDLMCRSMYIHYDKNKLVDNWDFLDIFEQCYEDRIVNINIKLFDRNLFGVSKSNKRKRNRE